MYFILLNFVLFKDFLMLLDSEFFFFIKIGSYVVFCLLKVEGVLIVMKFVKIVD